VSSPSGDEELFGEEMMRAARGECPSAEDLVAYAEGRLADAEQRTRLEGHIRLCGLCDVLVSRMTGPESAAPGEEDVAARLRGRFEAFVAGEEERNNEGVGAGRTGWLRRWVFTPAVWGYAAAVLLAVPAVQHWRERGMERSAAIGQPPATTTAAARPAAAGAGGAFAGAQRFELERTRSGGGVEVRPSADRLILSFVIAVRGGASYTAAIETAAGDRVVGAAVPVRPSGDGYSYVVCERSALPNGEYRLRVKGEPGRDGDDQVFAFTVR
jgi:hypothetical protein